MTARRRVRTAPGARSSNDLRPDQTGSGSDTWPQRQDGGRVQPAASSPGAALGVPPGAPRPRFADLDEDDFDAEEETVTPDLEKKKLTAAARRKIPRSQFAYVDSEGGEHLPVHDAGHVHSALGRFAQQHFESPADRRRAAKRILAAASRHGIDVDPDSTVAGAAKVMTGWSHPAQTEPVPGTYRDSPANSPSPRGRDLAQGHRDLQQQPNNLLGATEKTYEGTPGAHPENSSVNGAVPDVRLQFLDYRSSANPSLGSQLRANPDLLAPRPEMRTAPIAAPAGDSNPLAAFTRRAPGE